MSSLIVPGRSNCIMIETSSGRLPGYFKIMVVMGICRFFASVHVHDGYQLHTG